MVESKRDGEQNAGLECMLPVVPEEIAADPLLLALLQCAAFLDFGDEQTVDQDAATEVLDHVAYYVRQLPKERIAQLQTQLERLEEHGTSEGWPRELAEFVGDFLDSCTADDEDEDSAEADA